MSLTLPVLLLAPLLQTKGHHRLDVVPVPEVSCVRLGQQREVTQQGQSHLQSGLLADVVQQQGHLVVEIFHHFGQKNKFGFTNIAKLGSLFFSAQMVVIIRPPLIFIHSLLSVCHFPSAALV